MKNIELLQVSEEAVGAILKKTRKYASNYGLFFKISNVSEEEVCVSVSQINPDAKKIFDKEELAEIVHDVFDENILPSHHLKIVCNTIDGAPTKDVDLNWIKRRMYQTSTKLKQMTKDFGLPKNGLDDFFNGTRPISKVERAMFYYYLEYRALLKEKGQDTSQFENEGTD